MPSPGCCCVCENVSSCLQSGDDVEIVFTGIANDFCGSCTQMNDTFLLDAVSDAIDTASCCSSWGIFPSQSAVCSGVGAYHVLFMMSNSLRPVLGSLDNPGPGIQAVIRVIKPIGGNVIEYVMVWRKLGTEAILSFCRGDIQTLAYAGRGPYSSNPGFSAPRPNCNSLYNPSVTYNNDCDGSGSTCTVQKV